MHTRRAAPSWGCSPATTVAPPAACPSVRVRYEIAGPTDAVVVRAVPMAGATRPDGSPAPETTIEVVGRPDADTITLGCLLPGSGYTIEVDVQGDGLGPLLTREVVAPGG